ncbi:MAG: hypothetical protein NTV77_00470 [Candidatus Azambacteria bacterium]|nr:hypothetical protein [Candidatus Azambacteria bacterium]
MTKEIPIMEKFRKKALEKITFEMFKKSPMGNISAIIYFIIAIGSIFLYWKVFNLNIIFSIFGGIITWFVATFIGDKILINFLRIDKSIKFCKTPEGVERLKKIGRYSDEEIKNIQKLTEATEEELEKMELLK